MRKNYRNLMGCTLGVMLIAGVGPAFGQGADDCNNAQAIAGVEHRVRAHAAAGYLIVIAQDARLSDIGSSIEMHSAVTCIAAKRSSARYSPTRSTMNNVGPAACKRSINTRPKRRVGRLGRWHSPPRHR